MKTCGKPLAPGNWWGYCGETDMGQTAPIQCNECDPIDGLPLLEKTQMSNNLRQAAQAALEALDAMHKTLIFSGSRESVLSTDLKRRAEALRAALAEPQPEPVAKPALEASRLALFARAMGHPAVLEIMADCADCIDTENSAQHDPEVFPYDGAKWVSLAAELRQQATEIRAEDPEIWAPQAQHPLTDEGIAWLWSWSASSDAEQTATTQQHAFARAIERAHKIGA